MVTVIDKNGNKHEFSGKRLETIIQVILDNAGEIVKPLTAKIEIHCSGSAVSATIQKTMEIARPED